jgi:hypothetical protein
MTERLVFGYSLKDRPAGDVKGSKYEYVTNPGDPKWNTLNSIPNWRRVLSSLYPSPMQIDGKSFMTVEHYLQYRKIKIANPKLADETFPMESKSGVSLSNGYAAQKCKKIALLNKEQWELWERLYFLKPRLKLGLLNLLVEVSHIKC